MPELINAELSYKIRGVLFEVYNELGGGYQEKYYQRAIAGALRKRKIGFREQLVVPLEFQGSSIGRYFLDFLIEEQVVLEIKAENKFYPRDIKQILAYLKRADLPLGILANFSKGGLQIKRVLKGR